MIITILCLLAMVVLSYLFGSVNFAIIVTRLFAKKDIRDFGSGNAGMTNVLRTLGKGPAALTFLGDFAKGALSVLITRLVFTVLLKQPDNFVVEYAAAFSALLGHIFPLYYGFKGGKGIAVSAGALIALSPLAFLCCLVVFLVFFLITKIVSVGSIACAVAFPISVLVLKLCFGEPHVLLETLLAALIALLVIYMHRGNIVRLVHGEENSFSKKKKKPESEKQDGTKAEE